MRGLYAILVAVIFVCMWAALSFYFAFPELMHSIISTILSSRDSAEIEKLLNSIKHDKLIIYYNHTAIIVLIIIDYVYSLIKKYGGVNIGGVYLVLLVAFLVCLTISLITVYLLQNDSINVVNLGLGFIISVTLAKFFTLFTPHKLEKLS